MVTGLELPRGQDVAIGVGVAEQPQARVEAAIIRPGIDEGLANQRPAGMRQDGSIGRQVEPSREGRNRVWGVMGRPAQSPGHGREGHQPMREARGPRGVVVRGQGSAERSSHDGLRRWGRRLGPTGMTGPARPAWMRDGVRAATWYGAVGGPPS